MSFAINDLNLDNKLDIVLANFDADSFGVLLSSDSKLFSDVAFYSTGINSTPIHVTTGDFNNDNFKDIAVANAGASNIGIFLGNGNGTFQNMTSYPTILGSYPISIAVKDLNDDSCLDAIVANMVTSSIEIFIGQCDGTFKRKISYSTAQIFLPMSIALSDFNNDNFTDICVANYGSNTVGILFGYGNGTFGNQLSSSVSYGSHPLSIAVGDLNQDGWVDIVIANKETDTLNILMNSC